MAGPEALFRQLVTFAEVTGRDAYGKPSLGPLTVVAARVQPSRKLIRDANGAEFVASFIVYTAAPITLRHRVWLPGEDTANFDRARRPAAIDEHADGTGVVRYRKVFF